MDFWNQINNELFAHEYCKLFCDLIKCLLFLSFNSLLASKRDGTFFVSYFESFHFFKIALFMERTWHEVRTINFMKKMWWKIWIFIGNPLREIINLKMKINSPKKKNNKSTDFFYFFTLMNMNIKKWYSHSNKTKFDTKSLKPENFL